MKTSNRLVIQSTLALSLVLQHVDSFALRARRLEEGSVTNHEPTILDMSDAVYGTRQPFCQGPGYASCPKP